MDYPFPLIRFDAEGRLDLSDAYAVGMGEWDKRVILYGYQDFPVGVDADLERRRIVEETVSSGLKYVSDEDSRDIGTAHPDGNLWDNGADAIEELTHLLRVRAYVLGRFSEDVIRQGRPLATIEEALVPIYLLHRFQLQAVGKFIGGQYFNYAMRGDGQAATRQVDADKQRAAIAVLLATLDPAVLRLPQSIVDSLPARPPGFEKSRETFPNNTGSTFDPLGPARSAVALTLEVLLDPARASRMIVANAADSAMPGFHELTDSLLDRTWYAGPRTVIDGAIQRAVNIALLERLLLLTFDAEVSADVRALAAAAVNDLDTWLSPGNDRQGNSLWRAQHVLAREMIRQAREDPARLEKLVPVAVPPGSPIGSFQ
jgi:hypothetical protein